MRVRVLEESEEVKVFVSEMLVPTRKLGIYSRDDDAKDLPKAILSIFNVLPSVRSAKVLPFMIELFLDGPAENISEGVRSVIDHFDPVFSISDEFKKDIGGESDLVKIIPSPLKLQRSEEFLSLDDHFEDYHDILSCILMIEGVSMIRPSVRSLEIEKSYFSKWTSIIPQVEKQFRRLMRFESYTFG
jgi:hypothetical protein